jgi:hypothetical protein
MLNDQRQSLSSSTTETVLTLSCSSLSLRSLAFRTAHSSPSAASSSPSSSPACATKKVNPYQMILTTPVTGEPPPMLPTGTGSALGFDVHRHQHTPLISLRALTDLHVVEGGVVLPQLLQHGAQTGQRGIRSCTPPDIRAQLSVCSPSQVIRSCAPPDSRAQLFVCGTKSPGTLRCGCTGSCMQHQVNSFDPAARPSLAHWGGEHDEAMAQAGGLSSGAEEMTSH